MNVAIVGCGFVADYYLATLPLHPELKVVGVMDRDAERAGVFAAAYGVRTYANLGELLEDGRVEMALNLTNPGSHYEVSKAALLAGKHVYTEKPLAMEFSQAEELVELAEGRGLQIVSAPCSVLGESAQAIWKVLREGGLGKVRVVYAEMDDGMIPLTQHAKWRSASGMAWPAKDEFEVGCTLEHAGYYLTWLAAWFGPAVTVTSFASVQFPEKLPGVRLDVDSPDFSVACIQFASGVVARLTCSILAPHDHSLRIVADGGVLSTRECWDYQSPVYSRSLVTIRRKTFLNPWRRKYRLPVAPYGKTKGGMMDYARGPAELAEAVRNGRVCQLSPRFSLHVNEMALGIHWAREQGATYRMTTSFDPIEPAGWAK